MAVKRLLRQTLSHDDEIIDVHPLAELILSEGVRLGAGSSIKTDGEESDPWGLVGVVDIAKHRVGPSLTLYLCLITRADTSRSIVSHQELLDMMSQADFRQLGDALSSIGTDR